MLLIEELLLLNNYFGRIKMRYFYWKIAHRWRIRS